jgi:threonylcarbamoyladenosine tRNA methylthiotransferase MtaB
MMDEKSFGSVAIPRVAFHTLGCKVNYAETSSAARSFAERGFEVVDFGEIADVVVVNTCTVTLNADREARKIVRQALRRSPAAFVIVAGCYAQLRPEELASIEGVDLVLGTQEKFSMFELASPFRKGESARVIVGDIGSEIEAGPAFAADPNDRTRSFLKIQDGCDYNCAFCTIPMARGSSRSVDVPLLLSTARGIVESGFHEIVISGVNVGDYGSKNGSSLHSLLRGLLDIPGDFRVRISSIEPNLLTDEIIELAAGSEKLCAHFHVPLQSGSDRVLRLMRRRYNTELFRERIEAVRGRIPDCGIGLDVIVGHPGEAEEDFEATRAFLESVPFSYLHVFSYSERPGTHALSIPDRVSAADRAWRSEILREMSDRKRREFHEAQLGSVATVLLESESHRGYSVGYSGNYIRVGVPINSGLQNRMMKLRLKSIDGDVVIGERVDRD